MDIIRAFTTNNLHTEIVIKGTIEAPLFRASDIALILEISNIRASIKDFNESEKVVQTMTTPGGPQKVLFLTRTGLFRLLFRSKNTIALQVQYWVCDVVKELHTQRMHDVEMEMEIEQKNKILQLENNHKKYIEMEKQKIMECEKTCMPECVPIDSIVNENNQNALIQELVKTVQHLSSQIERLEKTNNALCEKINTMYTFSKAGSKLKIGEPPGGLCPPL